MDGEVRRFTKKEKIGWLCRLLLGLLFIVSGLLKFVSLEAFETYIFSFDVVGLTLSSFFARGLLFVEFAIGLFLVSTIWKREVELLTFVTLLAFSVFLLFLWIKGDGGNCHCMGEAFEFSPQESLLKNILYFVLLYFARYSFTFEMPSKKWWIGGIVMVCLLVPFLKLPAGLRPLKPVGFNEVEFQKLLSEEENLRNVMTKEKSLVCIFSVKCRHCKTAMKKLEVLLKRNSSTNVHWVVWGDESGLQEFLQETDVALRPHIFLTPDKLLPITENKIPLLLFFEKGEVIGKMSNSNFDDVKVEEFLK